MSQEEFLRWCDRLTVEVRAIPDRMSPPSEVWRVVIHDPSLDRDAFATALLDARDEGAPGDGFYLDEKRSYTSWGADGSMAEVILTVAEWAAAGGVGTIAANAFGKIWAQVRQAADEDMPASPVTRGEADARVRWTLHATYGVETEALRLVAESEDRDQHSWHFEYEHDGQSFEGTLKETSSTLPEVTHVRRTH